MRRRKERAASTTTPFSAFPAKKNDPFPATKKLSYSGKLNVISLGRSFI